jgi:hypothetical protein
MRILSLSVAVLLAGIFPVCANWGGEAGGSVGTGAFKPFGTAQVEMQTEDLTILLYRDHAHVRVEYTLKNTGEAVDLKAGFPCLAAKSAQQNYLEIEDYQLTANGQAIPHKTEPGDLGNWKTLFDAEFLDTMSKYDDSPDAPGSDSKTCGQCRIWWLTSTVHFAKGETKQVKIEYQSHYEYNDGGPSNDTYYSNDYFRYLLSTASAWKGPIHEGKVTIQGATIDAASIVIKPQNRFQKTSGGFVWEFTNLKPTLADNVEVSLNNKFYTRFNYGTDKPGDSSWYSFEGNKYYFDFHGFTAQATSQKAGYAADQIADFANETAWVAGKNGGIGETVTLTLVKPVHVDQFGIVPGYAKSKELYFANNRIEQLEVSVNGGPPKLVTLPDDYIFFGPSSRKGYQLIDLGYAGEAKTIALTVKKVYPGTRYNDTCISEIMLRRRLAQKPQVQGAR